MREIKFRACIKRKFRKGYDIVYFDLMDLIYPLFSTRELVIPWLQEGNEPDEYTGLKDKNGKEIYEGDIIWYYVKEEKMKTGEIREVYNDKELIKWGIWEDSEYGYKINTWMIGNEYLSEYKEYANPHWIAIEERFEIIGNIYENPELLERG